MKKIFALIMTGIMTMSVLSGCGQAQAPAAEAPDAQTTEAPAAQTEETANTEAAEVTTVTPGKLTVATSPDFAPYEFYAIDEGGTPSLAGFDMDLAKYIADYMGLELEVVTVDFDGVLSELQTKSVDIGLAGLSPDPARDAIMDFSDLYYIGGQSFVCTEASKEKVVSMANANSADYTIGAQIGSIQMDLANENTPNAHIVAMPKVTDIVSELVAGKEDAAFIETDVAKCYQKNYPELVILEAVPYEQEGYAVGVCKGNAELLAKVNEAIKAVIEDGSMADYVAKANELATGEKYEGLLEEGNVIPKTE